VDGKMTDFQLLNFVEERGIQIWPTRKVKHGPVINWYVQNVCPFVQTYAPTLREALTKLKEAIDNK